MKRLAFSLFGLLLFIYLPVSATLVPADSSLQPGGRSAHLTQTVVRTGNNAGRPGIFQKAKNLVVRTLLARYKRADGEPTEKQIKQGRLSMILGIASIVLIFVPTIGILAIPAAITALVLGIKSSKGNSNTQSIVGIVTSSVTLFLIILALVYVAALFGSF